MEEGLKLESFPSSPSSPSITSAVDPIKSLTRLDKIIKLNVGGTVFQTTISTLKKDPQSMFSMMFEGNFPLQVPNWINLITHAD
jgi:hypothetical protein